jgi:hypothetical protein
MAQKQVEGRNFEIANTAEYECDEQAREAIYVHPSTFSGGSKDYILELADDI